MYEPDKWIDDKLLKKLGYPINKLSSFDINNLKESISSELKTEHLKVFMGDCADEVI